MTPEIYRRVQGLLESLKATNYSAPKNPGDAGSVFSTGYLEDSKTKVTIEVKVEIEE